MSKNEPVIYQNAEKCDDEVIKRVGKNSVELLAFDLSTKS